MKMISYELFRKMTNLTKLAYMGVSLDNIMRIKYLKTQGELYSDHLQLVRASPLSLSATKSISKTQRGSTVSLQTNFSIAVNSQYAFVLLHLRKVAASKNILTLNIPEVCIFHNQQPYELLFNQGEEIRSLRGRDGVRLREIHSFFRNRWKLRGLPKEEPCVACFQGQQYLMMSDTDLFITCRKFKNDPFFNRIAYLRNKLNPADNPLRVEYEAIEDSQFSGDAAQSLLGLRSEKEMLEKYGEARFLKYLSAKICLFLNYQHNIRVSRGCFFYLKTRNDYFLVNVSQLEFTNLTAAIRKRQKRLRLKEEERNRCLIMTPEKEERYRSHEKSPNVQDIEQSMNQSWLRIAQSLRIKTNQQRAMQQELNQRAFKVLYPSIKEKFDIVLNTHNFRKLRKDLFQLQTRRPLFKHTSHHFRRHSHSITEAQ